MALPEVRSKKAIERRLLPELSRPGHCGNPAGSEQPLTLLPREGPALGARERSLV